MNVETISRVRMRITSLYDQYAVAHPDAGPNDPEFYEGCRIFSTLATVMLAEEIAIYNRNVERERTEKEQAAKAQQEVADRLAATRTSE